MTDTTPWMPTNEMGMKVDDIIDFNTGLPTEVRIQKIVEMLQAVRPMILAELAETAAAHPASKWEPHEVRIEALNIASRETAARSFIGKTTVEIATEMVSFIEGREPEPSTEGMITHACPICRNVHLGPLAGESQSDASLPNRLVDPLDYDPLD